VKKIINFSNLHSFIKPVLKHVTIYTAHVKDTLMTSHQIISDHIYHPTI